MTQTHVEQLYRVWPAGGPNDREVKRVLYARTSEIAKDRYRGIYQLEPDFALVAEDTGEVSRPLPGP